MHLNFIPMERESSKTLYETDSVFAANIVRGLHAFKDSEFCKSGSLIEFLAIFTTYFVQSFANL
jgi:hypothetical protein